MKFPYGNADFYDIITDGYVYMDRTGRIPLIESSGKVLLFLRPRRFGKSLLLSTLENYYDINKAGEFERLFGHLAIGQNPTDRHNQYLILRWDFSVIDPQGTIGEIKQAMYDHLNSGIISFAKRYRMSDQIKVDRGNAIFSFESLLAAVPENHKVYLQIDEYDNFANEVLMAGLADSQQRYEALIQGEGMLKTLFKAIKAGTQGRGLERVFIAGVSPVVMSDITSGFNIAKNIYLMPQFNDVCGFQEVEIEAVLKQIGQTCNLSNEQVSQALEMMRTFYNGYRFSYSMRGSATPLVYNPTLALYFMEQFEQSCQYPRQMLDSNLAMDRAKIAYIAALPGGDQVVLNALSEDEAELLVIAEMANRFGVKDMLYAAKDTHFMISLLYYFGVLTLTDKRTEYGELVFQVPNLVARGLYAERIRELLLPTGPEMDEARRMGERLYQQGDIEPLCDFIEQRQFRVFDNRDLRWANELTVKTVFLSLLFNDTFYIMDSEPALQRQYADLVMIVRPDMRRYQLLDVLIEFKYVTLGQAELIGAQARALSRDELRQLPPIRQALEEAGRQLAGYRQRLIEVYGERLRLRAFSVVAVGLDRLVWQAA